jgi:hypothetical protein
VHRLTQPPDNIVGCGNAGSDDSAGKSGSDQAMTKRYQFGVDCQFSRNASFKPANDQRLGVYTTFGVGRTERYQ